MYDSTPDALIHIKQIQFVINEIIVPELEKRAKEHDQSKLESPEKETYDKYIPLLKKAKYGTPEYVKIRDEMAKTGLGHHVSVNRHHPEHFENGIHDMNLIDISEMLCDWFAASIRSDTGFEKGVQINQDKFKFSDDLSEIFLNTYNDYLKYYSEKIKEL